MSQEIITNQSSETQGSETKELVIEKSQDPTKTKRKIPVFKFEEEYVPENTKNTGLIIGKKKINLINLNKECREKFKSAVFILINRNSDNTVLKVQSNSQEAIKYAVSQLKNMENNKFERFNNKYNFQNQKMLDRKDIESIIVNKINRPDFRLWISTDLKYGRVYLRNKEDYELIRSEEEIVFNHFTKNIKYDHCVNFKFRCNGDADDTIKQQTKTILNDRMIIIIGKDKFKVYISDKGNFGKVFLKEHDDIENAIYGLNKYSQNDIEFIAYKFDKNNQRNNQNKNRDSKFSHALNVRNISNYITKSDIYSVIDKFIESEYSVVMKMREDDKELNKGFCKILVSNEQDCVNLLNRLSGNGFHGTIWDVSFSSVSQKY